MFDQLPHVADIVRVQRSSEGNIANVTGSSDVAVGILHQTTTFVELSATVQMFPFKEFTGFIIPARVLRCKSECRQGNPCTV